MDKFDLTPKEEKEKMEQAAPVSEDAPVRRRHARRDFSFASPQNCAPEEATVPSTEAADPLPAPAKASEDALPFEAEPTEVKEKIALSDLYEKAPEAEEDPEEVPLSSAGNLFDWVKSFLFSLTAVIFIFTLIFRGVTVSGGSMLPTLEDQEYLIISDLFYQPKTGDIVVVQSPSYKNGTEPLIKRVIATGGQTLKINFRTWQVWVDGVELQEDYIAFEEGLNMNPEDLETDENFEVELVVEENCIFVMGDYRNDSLDSRSEAVGQIDQRYIMGRVMLRVTPFSKFGKVE